MGINTAQFANLYAWYSWPNVILCFIGGFLLDRYFISLILCIHSQLFITNIQMVLGFLECNWGQLYLLH